MGGDDSPSNLVYLTAKEHYVCHVLLAKTHQTRDLWAAVILFRGSAKQKRFTGTMYEAAKIFRSEYMKNHNPNLGKSPWNKGLKFSQDSKNKMSEAHIQDRKIKKECPHCKITIDKQNFSRWHGENCKMSPNYVKPVHKSRKKPTSSGPRNLKLVTCPHCGKQGKGGNMTRWHFDNCKHKSL